jgi:predicted GNAT family N-acyltransferase
MGRLTLPDDLRLGVLAPRAIAVCCDSSRALYESRLAEIQRLRGRVYRAEGAIPDELLDSDGRHFTKFDYDNWHLFAMTRQSEICACFRLRLHDRDITPNELKLWEFVQRMSGSNACAYAEAIGGFVRQAENEGTRIGEVGGWAVAENARNRAEAMTLPFAAWSLFQIIGDAIVLSAATARHRSASILKKIGGFPLSHTGRPVPKFFDPFHGCDMEFVCYDSRKPAPRYEPIVKQIQARLLPLIRAEGVQNEKTISFSRAL